ncbi:uncharacterized protein LOC121836337 [Ixodes scapularis]|uniref:uncharacterized protein LOC121836337 n=1 Tax=Ixodes scapularis TaxID=6945 RepID=UPI001C38DF9D|nr:uncharacterized protein LOC121836337 [Ixodes scapularis]
MDQPPPAETPERGDPGPSHGKSPPQCTAPPPSTLIPGDLKKAPIKRRCTDPDSYHDDDDDKTSTYSVQDAILHSNEDESPEDPMQVLEADEDNRPFTSVHYKKNRPAGIPVVFKPNSSNASLWRVNPNEVAKEIIDVAQEKLLSHRMNKDGSLFVSVASLQAANRLLAISTLCSIEVATSVPHSYSRNLGKIKGVPIEYTDGEPLDYFKNLGVISVQRKISYRRQGDGNVEHRKTESVLLHFRPDQPMPTRVLLGFTSHSVDEYFGPPVQCYHCQRYGHIAQYCRGPRRCKVCAGPHHHKTCTNRQDPKCANCGNQHAATFSGCQRRKAASVIRRQDVLNGKENRGFAATLNPEVVRVPLPVPVPTDKRAQKPTYSDALKKTTNGVKEKHRERRPHEDAPETARGIPSTMQLLKSAPITQTTIRQPMSVSSAPRRKRQEQAGDLGSVLIPMLFAALRAIIKAIPDSDNLPEVQALLAMESFLNVGPFHR